MLTLMKKCWTLAYKLVSEISCTSKSCLKRILVKFNKPVDHLEFGLNTSATVIYLELMIISRTKNKFGADLKCTNTECKNILSL